MTDADTKSRQYAELAKLSPYRQQAWEGLVRLMLPILEERENEIGERAAELDAQIGDLTARINEQDARRFAWASVGLEEMHFAIEL